MALTRAFKTLALHLQEADSLEISNQDVCSALNDCLNDMYPGKYCYVCATFGDGESGDVVYYCGGQYYRAPYEVGMANGKRTHSIEVEDAQNVLPRTVYDQEADEDDVDGEMYGGAQESLKSGKLFERFPGSAEWKRPFAERFISKKTRDAANDSDFAGSGRSFPILKKADVMAAVRSIGRGVAGGQKASSIKAGIIRIAKRKGFADALPDAWKGDGDSSESSSWKPDGALFLESARFMEEPRLQEAATASYPIKLISPGRGSSGYYPPEVLKKAAEGKVFKAGTQMFWNHDTDAEESARPEGDLNRLAAVTTSDAVYDEAGKDGPGLYAHAKVFSDYADKVKEKGPHIGLSIRAGGERDEAAKGPDGKPRVITALKNAQSVDFVTKAGRDGKIFTEGAVSQEGDESMEKNEIAALIKEAVAEAVKPLQAANQRLTEALATQKAPGIIREALNDIRLPDASKKKILEKLTSETVMAMLPVKEGQLDREALEKLVETEAKKEAAFLMELGYGDGIAAVGGRMTEKDLEASEKQHEKHFEESQAILADLFVGPKIGKGGLDDAAREARKAARKAFMNGRAA